MVVLAFAVAASARAQSVDDQYVRIYNLIQDANSSEGAEPAQALAKYREALAALQKFQGINPDWNAQVVKFRATYLATKIAELAQRVPAVTPANGSHPGDGTSAAPAPPADWEDQLAALRDQVRDLQSEKSVLEVKLKEALSLQPAPLDPQQLAAAQARIKALQKDNDLLNVRLDEEKSRTAPAADARAYALATQQLAEANRKLDNQTKRADALAQEKQYLQSKLSALAPTPENAGALAAARKELVDADTRLASETQLATRLAQEKDVLLSRVKELTADKDAASALRAENDVLKKQLAESKSPHPAGKAGKAELELKGAEAQIAALQSEKEVLRLENIVLRQQLGTRAPAAAAPASVAANPKPVIAEPQSSKPEDLQRIKQLEQERDSLQARLDTAIKGASGRKGKEAAARVVELETQVASLHAQIDVLEAHPVPYTPEELALFQKPEAKLAEPAPAPVASPAAAPSADTRALMADARRHFEHDELDQAEADYLQALRHDDRNVVMLANLAMIEVQRDHLDDAEKHVRQALDVAPNDAFSLLTLGQLRFRQENYKEALDVLSRAEKLDPQNPQIQNYLGITLSQLGMRGPAETALRKAIQIDPNFAGAHHNLAVIYITQKPPLVELARWHYQKALASGQPRNPDLEKLFEVRPPIE
jgi:Tfp pilus assembly protein PilF